MNHRPLADPILMEVFSNRLLSITEEMGTNLIRASFSTNIKERRDCSVGLFDAGGRLIAQAAHIPLHLGSLLGAVEAVGRDFPRAEMRDGDAFLCNDPYLAAGTHMPDISVVTLVFVARAPIAAPIPKNARALTPAATARERVVATLLRGRGRGVESAVIAGLLLIREPPVWRPRDQSTTSVWEARVGPLWISCEP